MIDLYRDRQAERRLLQRAKALAADEGTRLHAPEWLGKVWGFVKNLSWVGLLLLFLLSFLLAERSAEAWRWALSALLLLTAHHGARAFLRHEMEAFNNPLNSLLPVSRALYQRQIRCRALLSSLAALVLFLAFAALALWRGEVGFSWPTLLAAYAGVFLVCLATHHFLESLDGPLSWLTVGLAVVCFFFEDIELRVLQRFFAFYETMPWVRALGEGAESWPAALGCLGVGLLAAVLLLWREVFNVAPYRIAFYELYGASDGLTNQFDYEESEEVESLVQRAEEEMPQVLTADEDEREELSAEVADLVAEPKGTVERFLWSRWTDKERALASAAGLQEGRQLTNWLRMSGFLMLTVFGHRLLVETEMEGSLVPLIVVQGFLVLGLFHGGWYVKTCLQCVSFPPNGIVPLIAVFPFDLRNLRRLAFWEAVVRLPVAMLLIGLFAELSLRAHGLERSVGAMIETNVLMLGFLILAFLVWFVFQFANEWLSAWRGFGITLVFSMSIFGMLALAVSLGIITFSRFNLSYQEGVVGVLLVFFFPAMLIAWVALRLLRRRLRHPKLDKLRFKK
ncbi:MAG: hypothetical protein ACQKBY_13330 [Verrucomicrobiales bacterium]